MTSPPDTLTVTAQHFADVRSAGAHVALSVSETGLGARSTGRVADLRATLAARGFTEADLSLLDVDRTSWAWIALAIGVPVTFGAAFASGRVAALSTAGAFLVALVVLWALSLGTITARLRVRCADGERVAKVIDLAFAERGVDLGGIAWDYEAAAVEQGDWAVLAAERARERANRIAAALGVRIVAVHAFEEVHALPEPQVSEPVVAAPRARRAMAASASLMATPSAAARAGVTVTVRYRVAPVEGA